MVQCLFRFGPEYCNRGGGIKLGDNRNYAQVTRRGNKDKNFRWRAKTRDDIWWDMDIKLEVKIEDQMVGKLLCGKIKRLDSICRLDEAYVVGGFGEVKLRYLGDEMVLINEIRE